MNSLARPAHTLVLWDVDHTLLETRGVGRAIYDRAFLAATGRPLEQLAQIAGRTELDIMAESLRINGIEPTTAMIEQLANALVHEYELAREELGTVGRVLPGAREALARLAADPAVHQGLLTGNLRQVARIKLAVFHLDQYVDFGSSAFGDDHPNRAMLVKIAQRRAHERTGARFESPNTVLIGDTPNDVRAAQEAGVRMVAVATGKSSVDDLRNAGAPDVINDLSHFRTV